jgi:hypothetical protein
MMHTQMGRDLVEPIPMLLVRLNDSSIIDTVSCLAQGLTSPVFSYMEELQRPGGVRKQGKFSLMLIQNHGLKMTEK